MCKFTTNAGLGPPLENAEGVFGDTGWYATNQFAVDVIFNNRMKQYECLTNDSSVAAAVFVPFYAGFDIARYLWGFNISRRDAASLDLERMRRLKRDWLFSFAGAPRPGNPKSIRGQIIDQCRNSKVGKLLECDFGESKCHSPSSIMQMFQSSLFCLQPQGDSYTRRSAFDSMLAGCIPVFFHPGSAYTQYTWHLPKDYTKYSVFIPENDIRKGTLA
ncbi:Exostosin-like protein [Prunus yedoensis var. nudiflora]|uniref:Exostosin-like protein n=1 Tax=Prunus yedoensis var. nudiflora TaxID=2094558 RepID=A0A314ZG14_PRUYE|nr:Exostosin-like protein [Prunus yedoensis var. nudiflora]